MDEDSKVFVAGHAGLVGSAIVRRLSERGYGDLVLRTHEELDLTDPLQVHGFFERERPEYAIIAAGLVGGIRANSEKPASFFLENIQIVCNVLQAARSFGVRKLLYLGSACMYPKECPQPMSEADILTGLPESTNEGYALAKICGSRLCAYMNRQHGTDFISAIPANAYGINDCFDPQRSHVIPALIAKYHAAKVTGTSQVELWGTGRALREFLYVDDIADACIFLMRNYSGDDPVNVGGGEEVSILELSRLVADTVGFEGGIVCDPTRPDGMMRRKVDGRRLASMGWAPQVPLEEGLRRTYEWYLENGLDRLEP